MSAKTRRKYKHDGTMSTMFTDRVLTALRQHNVALQSDGQV